MGLLLFFLVFYLLTSVALMKVFAKAGRKPINALIPGLNLVEWCELIGRPKWWAALLLIPIVNIFIWAGMAVDLVRSFGRYSFGWSALAVVLTPVAFFLLGTKEEYTYLGPTLIAEREYAEKLEAARATGREREVRKLEKNNPYYKSQTREWAEAIIFAVFAAAFIRMFLIEAYVIPTPSMEGSLLVGDFLFVSKAHYGVRTPETIAMIPLLHNRLPLVDGESYLDKPSLKHHRLPALENIDRNDPIVFNYPEGDSVYVFPERTWSVHDLRRGAIPAPYAQRIKSGRTKLVTRPMDKMDHYIKRAVAIPGDTLEIRNMDLYINGERAEDPENIQFIHLINFPEGTTINTRNFSEWGITRDDIMEQNEQYIVAVLNPAQRSQIEMMDPNIKVTRMDYGKLNPNPGKIFPHDPVRYPYTTDNFGPLYVPAAGTTVQLTLETLAPYRRIIDIYENNDLEVRDGQIYINSVATSEYTFKLNYYWAMGDNRHNSEDSRMWGFVPETHIVGKPLFIWFSTEEGSIKNGIRWNRIFRSASK